MKKSIMNIITDDNNITVGQAPFKTLNFDKFCTRCHIHSSDSVLLTYDSTVIGSSKKGFILTEKGINTPDWYLSWKDFVDYEIKKEGSKLITFSGKRELQIKASSAYDEVFDLFLRIKAFLEAKRVKEPLAFFDFKSVVLPLIFKDETISKFVYSNGIKNVQRFNEELNVHQAEAILLSYDTTAMGNSKVGMIMTERGIYQRRAFERATFLSWESFISATIVDAAQNGMYFVLQPENADEYRIALFAQQENFSKFLTEMHTALNAAYVDKDDELHESVDKDDMLPESVDKNDSLSEDWDWILNI